MEKINNQSGKTLLDIAVGILGTLSLLWLDVVNAVNMIAGFVAAVGGAILVIIRIIIAWRELRGKRKCKTD